MFYYNPDLCIYAYFNSKCPMSNLFQTVFVNSKTENKQQLSVLKANFAISVRYIKIQRAPAKINCMRSFSVSTE